MPAYSTPEEHIRAITDEHERLLAAAMKLDRYWTQATYGSERNVVVRMSAFADLRDLLGLKEKLYAPEPTKAHDCNAL